MPNRDSPFRSVDDQALQLLRELLTGLRACVLATGDGDGPYAAMVSFALEADGALLVPLSDLSAHKRHLLTDPRAAMLLSRPDDGRTEILQHPRLVLRCAADALAKDAPAFAAGRDRYLARHPGHAMLFGLPDFDLFRLAPRAGLLNAGFGRAYAVTPADLTAALRHHEQS